MASIKLKGDTSGEITIQAPSVAGTNTLNLQASSGTLATTAQASVGTKNLIINGDMRIAQRGTSSTGQTTGGYNTVDRWYQQIGSLGTWTFTQDTDVPSGQGFANSFKMDCTTADASPAASDFFILQQRLEGQNLQQLKKGTANAESVTLSFWVKSNKTGTYQVNLRDQDNTRHIGSTYTINTANTWEKKTITFSGDTTGALDNDNNNSLQLEWWFGSGSTFSSGSVPTLWEAADNADRNAGGTVNLADSTSNYINITGVQLEVGTEATPFENRPYDMELARCQRYFYDCTNVHGAGNVIGVGFMYDGTRGRLWVSFPVNMRTVPAIISTNISASIEFNLNGNAARGNVATIPFAAAANPIGCMFQVSITTGSGTAGESRYVRYETLAAKIEFDAEL